MKFNILALSTTEKLLRKLITHSSTLNLHCVQFQVWFASLFAAAHLKSGLQVSGCLYIKILPAISFVDLTSQLS